MKVRNLQNVFSKKAGIVVQGTGQQVPIIARPAYEDWFLATFSGATRRVQDASAQKKTAL
jgi:hypothetical protein